MMDMSVGDNSKLATGEQCNSSSLFPEDRLSKLSAWTEISGQLLAKNLTARPLRLDDYHAGYLQLLSQLTRVGQVNFDEFKSRFEQMKRINMVDVHYLIVVIEDKQTNKTVATSTLFLEYKFIHQCAVRGRLEDVAVLDLYRGKQVGELLVKIIVELARETYDCYKLTLDCHDELTKFYSKNKFVRGANMLQIRFKD
uniref:Glucosamine 6-phosphate N-acetyltransferase n=1 Tax=Aceria tosichella TaxID=561515 RepID=A0A6G1S5J6_9ACAR